MDRTRASRGRTGIGLGIGLGGSNWRIGLRGVGWGGIRTRDQTERGWTEGAGLEVKQGGSD